MGYKTAILPVIAVLALLVTASTGIEIPKETQEMVATGGSLLITAGVAIWGIVKNHKKEGEK